eukprot:snap_masked-scaffold_75-processed-gene-0.50-mRNA-1 protein AED:1.00 eAED:1.00 QI:0/0/0/0/1/1/2/0/316
MNDEKLPKYSRMERIEDYFDFCLERFFCFDQEFDETDFLKFPQPKNLKPARTGEENEKRVFSYSSIVLNFFIYSCLCTLLFLYIKLEEKTENSLNLEPVFISLCFLFLLPQTLNSAAFTLISLISLVNKKIFISIGRKEPFLNGYFGFGPGLNEALSSNLVKRVIYLFVNIFYIPFKIFTNMNVSFKQKLKGSFYIFYVFLKTAKSEVELIICFFGVLFLQIFQKKIILLLSVPRKSITKKLLTVVSDHKKAIRPIYFPERYIKPFDNTFGLYSEKKDKFCDCFQAVDNQVPKRDLNLTHFIEHREEYVGNVLAQA